MADIQVNIGLNSGNGNYVLKKQRINSIHSLSQSNSDASTIFYGTLSNTGSIEISDRNNEIENLIKQGEISSSNTDINIILNKNNLQRHKTSSSGYEDNILNISLENSLTEISVSVFDNQNEKHFTNIDGASLLVKICQDSYPKIQVPHSSFEVPANDLNTQNIIELLQRTSFNNVDLGFSNESTEVLLNKLCEATQTNIFADNNGDLEIMPARPIISNSEALSLKENSIYIPKKYIYENGKTSLFLKNKYKQVNIDVLCYNEESVSNINTKMTFEDYSEALTYINERAFYKFDNISKNDTPIDETTNAYIYIREIENNYYISQTIENNYYTFALDENGVIKYYILSDGNYFPVGNTSSIENFKNAVEQHIGNNPFVCAFLNWQNAVPTKKYSIIYAINKTAQLNNYTAWIIGKPNKVLHDWMAVPFSYRKLTPYYKTFSFKTYEDVVSENEIFEIKENPFITQDSVIKTWDKTFPLYEYIAKNILNDYFSGIRTKNIEIACGDFYYYKNPQIKAKNFNSGQIIQVGDKIVIDNEFDWFGSLINWKVTGAEFIYEGSPMLKLELQECLQISKLNNWEYGLFKDGALVYNWNSLLERGLISIENKNLVKASSELDGELIVSTDIDSISEYSFAECSLLYNVELPNKITEIPTRAFSKCMGITNFKCPLGLKKIGVYSFYNCNNLQKVVFNEILETIDGSFQGCYNLDNVIIPDSVTEIGSYSFADCVLLTKIKLSSSINKIKEYTFAGCVNLSSLIIPDNVTAIEANAFNGCSNLTTLIMPYKFSLTSMFGTTPNLVNVALTKETSMSWDSIFRGNKTIKTVYLPETMKTITVGIPEEYPNQKPFLNCDSSLVIYTGNSSAPVGWGKDWNAYYYDSSTGKYSYLTVKYGYTLEEYKSEVGLS